MGKRATVGIMLTLLLTSMLTLASTIVSGSAEEWVPYAPLPHQMDLIFWMEKQMACIKVCITFTDAGYNVSNWGDAVKEKNEIWADSEIWDWTGPAALVITTLCHTYNLGELESGTYTFTFKAWGLPVKTITFIVPLIGDVNGDGIVNGGDMIIVGNALFTQPGDARWNPNADVDGNGIVQGGDLIIVARALTIPYNPLDPVDQIGPTVVDNTVATYDATYPGAPMRRCFKKLGLFWVFFPHSNGDFGYKTSSDGTNWSSFHVLHASTRRVDGRYCAIWADASNNLHYVVATLSNGYYYRKGILQTDGSINWAAPEQQVDNIVVSMVCITVDLSGHAWIGYRTNASPTSGAPYITRNNNTDGTWLTTSSFPVQLGSTGTDDMYAWAVPLTGNTVYVIWQYVVSNIFRGRRWNGIGWDKQGTIDESVGTNSHAAVSVGDDIYLCYQVKTHPNQIRFKKWTGATGSWGSYETVDDGTHTTSTTAPTITIGPNNTLYVFWTNVTYLYYRYRMGTEWSALQTLIGGEGNLCSDSLSSFWEHESTWRGMIWTTSTSPYTLKFLCFNFNSENS